MTIQPSQAQQDKALYHAVCTGNAGEVSQLLAAGGDASYTDPATGRPCLHEAAIRGFSGVMDKLLFAGAAVNAYDSDGCTALLHVSRRKECFGMLRVLLEAGADPNAARIDARGRSCDAPLHHRCDHSDMMTIGMLLNAGADPLQVDLATGKSAYQTIPSICKGVQRQVKPYIDLPRVDISAPVKRTALLQEDDQGLTPLANPLTWRQLPQINAQLEKAGDAPIGKAEAFRPASDGLSAMARLGGSDLFGYMAKLFLSQGERLRVADFTATPQTAALLEKPAVLNVLFSHDNVRLGKPADIDRDRRDLPQHLHGKIGNFHLLRTTLRQEQETAERRDYGRRTIAM